MLLSTIMIVTWRDTHNNHQRVEKQAATMSRIVTRSRPFLGSPCVQVSLNLPRRFCHCSLTPSEEVQSAVTLLGSEVMARWQHFLKKIYIDATTSIFPITSPTRRGQLLYRIEIEHTSVVALLDHGASHSFLTQEWAIRNHVPMKPLL